jgi:hypothetical protein
MRNLWGYISRPQSLHGNTSSGNVEVQHEEGQERSEQPISIDYYRLKEFWETLRQNKEITTYFTYPSSSVIATFSDVMGSLEGLLHVVGQLRAEADKNAERLGEYEMLKGLAGQHTEIVKALQEEFSNNINKVYEEKRTASEQFTAQM